MNVKFYKNCENTGKILKISCVRCNFVKFVIHFMLMLEFILVQGLCPLKIKITQFPDGFRLNMHAFIHSTIIYLFIYLFTFQFISKTTHLLFERFVSFI